MSLKDDFLEALKSVKRDFFKDYEYTEEDAKLQTAGVAPSENDAFLNPPVQSQLTGSEDNGPAVDMRAAKDQDEREATFNAFLKATAQNKDTEDLHSEEDEDDFAPDVDPTPFRTLNGDDGGNIPPIHDRRLIIDNYDYGSMDDNDHTVISRNTVIRGALQTDDSVRMFGQILGDIDCKSNILVAGKVRGNTSAANAYVIDAQVDGNLLCDDVVNINDDAWILGNIRAQQAEVDGKVKGNIEIRHTISIGSNSSVIGNISTDELEIKRGAFINGQIMMYSPSRDVIDRFDQFDR